MNTTLRAPDVRHRPVQAHLQLTLYWVGALVFSALVVVGARVWFDTLQDLWPTSDGTIQGLQFGSFLLVLGGIGAWRWPGLAAVAVGSTVRDWRVVLSAAAVAAAMTGLGRTRVAADQRGNEPDRLGPLACWKDAPRAAASVR